jgi:uncharacterized protein (DUF58 family)
MIYTSTMDTDTELIRKVKLNNYLLPIIVIGLIIQQVIEQHRAWEILLVAFGGALILSASWAIALWKGLSFSREMRHGWAQVGDKFSEQFTISNKSRFSAFSVSLYDRSNFPGYQSSVAWPVSKQFDKLWYLDSMCYKRGLYRVGPAEIRTSDPFGIFEVTIKSLLEKEILVTPPIVPLLEIEIASGEWQSDGGVKTRVYERSVTASSVREYHSGDNLYSVHWLTSARRDDLFVRTFDQNPSSDWWIFLDLDRSVQAGEGLDTTDEYGAVLAASIADRGLKENRAVGLVGEGSKSLWLPPKTGMGQRAEIMYSLALVDLGDQSLKTLLARSQRSLGRKSSVIVVTPSIDPEWLGALTTLKQRGVATTVLSLDPVEFGGEGTSAPILAQLDACGIRNYSIKKSIYQRPEIQDYFPNKGSALSIYAEMKGETEL